MIRIMKFGDVPHDEIFARAVPETDVCGTVSAIIDAVRTGGDAAVLAYTERFDRVKPASLEIPRAELEAALGSLPPELRRVMTQAAANIRTFHARQVRNSFVYTQEGGVVTGQKVTPVDRAGIYVPGGTAPLSSTVLMDCIPAKIAGCGEVIMVTPPGPDGRVHPAILAAAAIAGVDRVFSIGGAQAIAALAYGTETIPRVDKIVGPGNAFVAEAKRQVSGQVGIDMIAGPSEILIVADGRNDPAVMAADMLSQAEHDKLASAVLVTDSMDLALAVDKELERQLALLPRKEIAEVSIRSNGRIIVTDDLASAVDVANEIAPEHLELCVEQPFDWLDRVRHAGSVFMGRWCPEALGDYMAGANHTLPTSGTARFSSPLSVDDFVKKTQFTYYTKEALSKIAKDVAAFAECESLRAHARSALIRTEVLDG